MNFGPETGLRLVGGILDIWKVDREKRKERGRKKGGERWGARVRRTVPRSGAWNHKNSLGSLGSALKLIIPTLHYKMFHSNPQYMCSKITDFVRPYHTEY